MTNRLIGDRAFYKRILAIAVPIIIQNGITNLVTLLDNIMVGQMGGPQMAGVSVVNQFIFIFNLCLFGANSGAGIFTAQFFGCGDHDGIRHTFRFKLIACSLISFLGIGVFSAFHPHLINWFLQGEGTPEEIQQTLLNGKDYLFVMLWGLLPFGITNAYAGTLRECGQSKIPMLAGISAVFVNLGLNYVLIFGHFGFPAMGVKGAALATVISRFVELGIVMLWTHTHSKEQPFIVGAFRSFRIPVQLLRRIVANGTPLLINEALWSFGITFLNQCYSTCGFDVVNATNIATTVSNLASVVTMALGNTVGIIMGQMLGSIQDEAELRRRNTQMITLAVVASVVFGGVLVGISGIFPKAYNTTDSIRHIATSLIIVTGLMKPFHGYMFAAYYTLRSGGKTWITFLYDSGFLWVFTAPLAYCLTAFTDLPILPVYILCQLPDMLKCVLGFLMIRRGSWIQNLTR